MDPEVRQSIYPRIVVSALVRGQAYGAAKEFDRTGCLHCLYAAYPRWRISEVSQSRLRTFPWFAILTYAAQRLGCLSVVSTLRWPATDLFDRWVAGQLELCDVVFGMSSGCLHAFRTARGRFNALTDCHRGNTHIEYQSRLLASESEYHGVPAERVDQRLIDKELQEYAEADLITVSSTFAYQSFVEQDVPAEKIVINTEGVNLSRFQPVAKEDNIFRVLYVGQLSLRKGIPYLLEAFADLRVPRFELVLVGQITDRRVRPFLAKYEGGFRYLGPVANAGLAYYYSQASVFVLPSIEDGFGLVIAEAMACGLPVVATTNTGAPDLITDGVEGFIVPIRDPLSLREKVLRLYKDRVLRQQMSAAALRRAEGLGGWKSYADRQLLVYRERLGDRGRTPGEKG